MGTGRTKEGLGRSINHTVSTLLVSRRFLDGFKAKITVSFTAFSRLYVFTIGDKKGLRAQTGLSLDWVDTRK